MSLYPTDQGMPGAAIPVRLVNSAATAFVTPASSTGPAPAGTATVTSVPASAASGQALATNTARLGAMFFNSGTAGNVFLIYGAGQASSSSFTVLIAPGGFFNMPVLYSGAIQVVWSTITGAGPLMVTELTP